jgi:hypothetical protein
MQKKEIKILEIFYFCFLVCSFLTEKGRRQNTGDRRQKGKSRKLIREFEIRELGILGEN